MNLSNKEAHFLQLVLYYFIVCEGWNFKQTSDYCKEYLPRFCELISRDEHSVKDVIWRGRSKERARLPSERLQTSTQAIILPYQHDKLVDDKSFWDKFGDVLPLGVSTRAITSGLKLSTGARVSFIYARRLFSLLSPLFMDHECMEWAWEAYEEQFTPDSTGQNSVAKTARQICEEVKERWDADPLKMAYGGLRCPWTVLPSLFMQKICAKKRSKVEGVGEFEAKRVADFEHLCVWTMDTSKEDYLGVWTKICRLDEKFNDIKFEKEKFDVEELFSYPMLSLLPRPDFYLNEDQRKIKAKISALETHNG